MQPYHIQLMKEALNEAKEGSKAGEVPVGAVIATRDGRIISKAHNRPISLNDPTAHAEILAIRKAGRVINNYRLMECVLAVTIEPCPMCMGAAINARISQLVFGARDPKSGAAGSVYDIGEDGLLNHSIEITSGILEPECRKLMRDFFKTRRRNR